LIVEKAQQPEGQQPLDQQPATQILNGARGYDARPN
jgi:hypothetical protein